MDKIAIPCQLMIDPEAIAQIFAGLGYVPGPGTTSVTNPVVAEVGRIEESDEPTFQVDPDAALEQQRMSIILQAAAHTHGKVVGGKIASAWSETDTNGLKMLSTIYPEEIAPLESIAEVIMGMSEVELTGTPAFAWLGGVFKKAVEIETGSEAAMVANEAEPEPPAAPAKPKRGRPKNPPKEKDHPRVLGLKGEGTGATMTGPCAVCGVAGSHSPGCPGAIADDGGGAIPVRIPGKSAPHPSEAVGKNAAQPFGSGVEVCPVGGYAGGCKLPHDLQFSGGARIPVHVREKVEALRAQLGIGPMPATPVWSAPKPPAGPAKSRIVRGKKR